MKYKVYEWPEGYLLVSEDGQQFTLVAWEGVEVPKGLKPVGEFQTKNPL